MLKYLVIPDFHIDPELMHIFRQTLFPAVLRAARENKPDFCLFPGDIHNKNFYLGKEYNEMMDFFGELMTICPCSGVSGTPGKHEIPPMYGALEKIGFVLLKPGKAYGWSKESNHIFETGMQDLYNDCILFGLPEIIPSRIQSELGYSSHEDYIREYLAPMRLQFENIPAILVIHGTVSDYSQENEIDNKKKNASSYIRTEKLSEANFTRVEAGHIHQPTKFEKINGDYGGSWAMNWGETGFVPAMNMVEIAEVRYSGGVTQTSITRIVYGTPRREKITAPLASYDPDIAYWLDSDDPDAPCPAGHQWSRVTHTPKRTESRRITQEQAQDASLRDLFKLFDPTVDEETLKLVDGLDWSGIQTRRAALDISVERVAVTGCIFWQGKSIELDLANLPDGLTQIDGRNGEGKSSLAAFCTPYPVIVGKDTKSGRPSAIKDFFDSPDSRIEKDLSVNGQWHHHLITIRGAHTQTPKVECYLEIDGKPQLERGTFDEMMAKCEDLYGSYLDYLLTTFYVQPLQGKTGSSLMSATMTDIRDLVQTIVGIDREAQKRKALDTTAAVEKELAEKEAWIKGAEENAVDVNALQAEIGNLKTQEAASQSGYDNICDLGKEKKQSLDTLRIQQTENNRQIERKKEHEKKLGAVHESIESLTWEIDSLKMLSLSLESNHFLILEDDARKTRMEARTNIINENAATQNTYDKSLNSYNSKLTELQLKIKRENNAAENAYQSDLSFYNTQKSKHESVITNNAYPCEHCGKIPYIHAEKAVAVARAALAVLVMPIKPASKPIPEGMPGEALPICPILFGVPDNEPCTINRPEIEAAITAGIKAQATIAEKTEARKKAYTEEAILQNTTIIIDDTIDALVTVAESELEELRKQASATKAELASLRTQIEAHEKAIADAQTQAERIRVEREFAITLADTLGRWRYIAVQLRPDKIPAMELDLVLDLIDIEATRNLDPYQEGALTFRTQTQRKGKKDVVDAFDILVHDNRTGREKSFLAHSPGQKAFLNDAYVKALIRIRNQRAHITYSPIISDEADSPIEIPMIPTFYAMQERYYTGERVLVISHTPDARNYIQNRIEIKELVK